ncbi:MAG: tetratricopeptide repeat protein [Bacteroidetes bacterium]|nr:tetratricopeptide repeat protein [Bacteroidota bacterium]
MAIWEKVLEKEHTNLAISLVNLAIIYFEKNQPNLALLQVEQAVANLQRCFPEGHPDLDWAVGWFTKIEKQLKSYESNFPDTY